MRLKLKGVRPTVGQVMVVDSTGKLTSADLAASTTTAATSLNTVTAAATANLALNTTSDDKQVRINSRSFTQASGDTMALQAKPSQTVTTTGTVKGGDISPRLQTGVGAGNLYGLHIDTDLKGTTGNISGAIKGIELELVSDVGRTSTVSGDVSGITFRSNMAMSISGHCTPLKVFNSEAAAGNWDALIKFEGTQAGIWNATPGTEPNTADGYIKVLFGSTARYIQLYSGAPAD